MTTVSDIATYAAIHKPAKNKAAAWSALQSVIVGDGTFEQLATLYRYFEPKATPAQLADDDFAWCAAAVEKGGHRDYLENVYCDGKGKLVATDGQRIHVATFDGAEGYYTPRGQLMEGATDEWTFPDWARAIPDETERLLWYRCLSEVFAIKGAKALEAYELADGTLVDRSLWDAAVAGRETAAYCLVPKDGFNQILLPDLGEGRSATVMSLNPKKVSKI